MRVSTKSISTFLMLLVFIFVLGYPNSSSLRAPIIIVAFSWMVLKNWRYLDFDKFDYRHILWAFMFVVLINVSRYWAYNINGITDINKNVLWSMMISLIVAEYIISYEVKVAEIASIMLPVIFVFLVNIAFNYTLGHGGRLSVAINENTFGNIALGLFIVIFYSIKEKKGLYKLLYIILSIALIMISLLSGSKRVVIGALIFIIAFTMFSYYSKNTIKVLGKIFLAIVLAGLLFVIVMKVPFLYNVVGIRVQEFVGFVFYNEQADASTNSRLNMSLIALNYFKSNPVLGIGINNFKYITYYNTYCHNGYLEILSGLGAVGFIVFYIPIIRYFRMAFIHWKLNHADSIFPLAYFLFFIVGEFSAVSYFSYVTHLFLGICIGLTINASNQIKIMRD